MTTMQDASHFRPSPCAHGRQHSKIKICPEPSHRGSQLGENRHYESIPCGYQNNSGKKKKKKTWILHCSKRLHVLNQLNFTKDSTAATKLTDDEKFLIHPNLWHSMLLN